MNRRTLPLGRWATALILLGFGSAAAPAPPAAALARAGEELAALLAADRTQPELIALAVSAPGAQLLALPLETAIAEALSRRGFSTAPLRASESTDPAARRLGADRLLRVTASMLVDKGQLSLTAEVWPTRPSFFLQRALQVRPGSGRLWTLTVPADTATLALTRASPRPPLQTAQIVVKPLLRMAERVLALAAGDPTGDGSVAIAVVTPSAVSLFSRTGALLARRELEPGDRVRHPAAMVAMGSFAGGRIALQLAGGKAGMVLSYGDGALRPVASLTAVPLATLGARQLLASFLPGRATFTEQPAPEPPALDSAAPRRTASSRELVAFTAAPRSGRIAFAALQGDGLLQLFGPDLTVADSPLAGIGTGFALADLDGSGEPKLVASSTDTGSLDRVRVLGLRSGEAGQLFESRPLAGSILAGTAADLTGDGLDDALLASLSTKGDTQLWLVTADAHLAGEPEAAPLSGATPP